MKKIIWFILILLTTPVTNLFSQTVAAKATLDTAKIIVGDQVMLKIQATYPLGTSVLWPAFNDSLNENIEIIKKSDVDTLSKSGNKLTLGQRLTITSFDSGSFYVPPISFKYKNPGDTAYQETYTDSLLFSINTVEVDTTLAIKDIKGPMSVPLTFREILPYLFGIIALTLVVWLVIYYLRKRKKGESLIGFSKPKLPPHEIALSALNDLRNKKLWQNSFVKEYYTELTDIIRTYIEGRYGILALEMTTDEIIEALIFHYIPGTLTNKLRQTLVLADLVKFAKSKPLPNEHDQSMDIAYEFVNETKLIIQPDIIKDQKTIENKTSQELTTSGEKNHAD